MIADQKVLVADKDNPVLCAFAAGTGEPVWRFVPGGRIDSSPAIYKGLVYFGASDGFVYCLDLSNGELRWRYQAAPAWRTTCTWSGWRRPTRSTATSW